MSQLFQSPMRYICSGPSGTGKTSHVMNILTNQEAYLAKPHSTVIYCTKEAQPQLNELQEKGFIQKILFNLPNESEMRELAVLHERLLLVVDDFGNYLDKNIR